MNLIRIAPGLYRYGDWDITKLEPGDAVYDPLFNRWIAESAGQKHQLFATLADAKDWVKTQPVKDQPNA